MSPATKQIKKIPLPRHLNIKLCLSILLCLFWLPGFSQFQNNSFTDYSAANGLSDNNISSITQDRHGYIWVGTSDGLNRFDGLNFKIFKNSDAKNSLPSNDILDLKWIDSNDLVIVTAGGINILNIETMQQENLVIPNGALKYSYKVNTIKNVLIDDEHNLYVISKSGFYHFDAGRKLVFRYDDYLASEAEVGMAFGTNFGWLDKAHIVLTGQKKDHYYNSRTRSIKTIDKQDKAFLLFGILNTLKRNDFYVLQCDKSKFLVLNSASDSLIYIDEGKRSVKFFKTSFPSVRSVFDWRSKLIMLNDSIFLLTGKDAGCYQVNVNTHDGSFVLNEADLFKNRKWNSYFKDGDNKNWLGFSDGLKAEKINSINLELSQDLIADSPGTKPSSILQLAKNSDHIYAAATDGGGLYQFDEKTLAFDKKILLTFPAYGNKRIFAVSAWKNDCILCGTDAGLICYDTKTGVDRNINIPGWNPHYWIADLFVDSRQNIWITSNVSGGCFLWEKDSVGPRWFSLDKKVTKELNEIYHIAEDPEGNIWFAGKGAARYNIKKKLIDIQLNSFGPEESKNKSIHAITCDGSGNVWMANFYYGLVLYEPATQRTKLFTTSDGLPDNNIRAVKYHDNVIWVVCKNGIAKINSASKNINTVCNFKEVNYKNFTSNELLFDEAKTSFYAAAGMVIARFTPNEKVEQAHAPKLIVESVQFQNDDVVWYPEKKIVTDWDNRDIILTFNAINFTDAAYQNYAYRILNNGDTSWHLLDEQRKIVFNKLGVGEHQIEIKVSSKNNLWTDQHLFFAIKVTAPFWKTWWFAALCFLAALGLCAVIFRYRYEQVKKIAKIREGLSQDLHDEVGSTLSGISMYGHLAKDQLTKNDMGALSDSLYIMQRSAGEMVNKLSDIVWLIKPEQDSLLVIINKLQEYAAEIAVAKNIKVNTILHGNIAAVKMAIKSRKNIYLICKEAINNAVKYSGAAMLEIKAEQAKGLFSICISDSGNGFDIDTIKKGNGLLNMQSRAQEIGAALTVEAKASEGVAVSLTVKI